MITGLSYLMTLITVGLLLIIARRQPHESQNGVDVYRPAVLTRAIAVLCPTVALMGVLLSRGLKISMPANRAPLANIRLDS